MASMNSELTLRGNSEHQIKVSVAEIADKIAGLHFVHFYDAAEVEQDSRMTPQDWTVSILLAGIPNWKNVRDSLWHEGKSRWRAVDVKLEQVDPQWRLIDERASEYKDKFEELLAAMLAVNGIQSPIATKILHKKRPNLIPVVDRIVAGFYLGRRLPLQKDSRQVETVSDVIFNHFRSDLLLKSNRIAIADIQSHLSENNDIPFLSDVRILELTIWLKYYAV